MTSITENPEEREVRGYRVLIDHVIGHLTVYHGGEVPWEHLQEIKSLVWGRDARAIEVYPADSNIVNSVNARHLWLLGARDFCPDLLGDAPSGDTLETRFRRGWQQANDAFLTH